MAYRSQKFLWPEWTVMLNYFLNPVLPCVHSQSSSFETPKTTVIFISSSFQIRWPSKLLGGLKRFWVTPKMLGVVASRSGTQRFYFWLRWSSSLGNHTSSLSSPFCKGENSPRDRKHVLLFLLGRPSLTLETMNSASLVTCNWSLEWVVPQWVAWGGVFNKFLRQM